MAAPTKIDTKKALALRLKGNTYKDIANMMGVTEQGVHAHLKPFLPLLEHAEGLPAFKANQADIYDVVRSKLIGSMIEPEKLQKASVNNLAYAAKAMHEMSRLERDQSTSNVAVQHVEALTSLEAVEKEISSITNSLPDKYQQVDDPTDNYNDAGIQAIEQEIKRITAQGIEIAEDTDADYDPLAG